MTKNVGSVDRILRVVIGLSLIALAATGTVGWWGYLGGRAFGNSRYRLVPTLCAVWVEHLQHEKGKLIAAGEVM